MTTPTTTTPRTSGRETVLEEIRQTGPISVDDVVRNLTGTVPRSTVIRTAYEATEAGDLDMDLRGRLRVRGEQSETPRRWFGRRR